MFLTYTRKIERNRLCVTAVYNPFTVSDGDDLLVRRAKLAPDTLLYPDSFNFIYNYEFVKKLNIPIINSQTFF